MRRMIAFNIGLFVSLALSSPAQTQDNTIGSSFGFTVALGSQGSFSFAEFGVVLPRMGDSFTMGIKIRAMSSLNWVPILDRDMDPAAVSPCDHRRHRDSGRKQPAHSRRVQDVRSLGDTSGIHFHTL